MEPHLQPPSVGRMVHYVDHGSQVCRAAIVTETTEHPDADGSVGLVILNPQSVAFKLEVEHAEDKAVGNPEHPGHTWHWPERV